MQSPHPDAPDENHPSALDERRAEPEPAATHVPHAHPSEPPAPESPPPRAARDPRRHGGPAAPRARKTSGAWLLGVMLFASGIGLGGACVTCAGVGGGEVVRAGADRVGVVELFDEIVDAKKVVEDLRRFGRNDDIDAVVLRIDSPGGAVAPSQEIYEAMRHVARKKPVVASMGSVAASGGFWVSLGADWVFAQPGTITGSIGVITQTPDLTQIAEVLRFQMRTFKSGPLKDAGNPFRPLTAEDEALFNFLVQDIYGQFVSLTAERRKLDEATVRAYADGRVMTGRAALEAKLIDQLGGLHEAAEKAAQLARERKGEPRESEDEPTLVYPPRDRPRLVDLLVESAAEAVHEGVVRGARSALSEGAARGAAPVELR
jgi:protease-4